MTREAGNRVEGGGERTREGGGRSTEAAASLSREANSSFESVGKKVSEPEKGSLSFDKPIYPNQQFAGLSTNTMTDAGGPYRAQNAAPDSVISKGSKQNPDGSHIDSSVYSSGDKESTTYDKHNQAIKNRTQHPDGSFNESTLDKNNNVSVREQKANGDFTETKISHDGTVTKKGRETNADSSVTDSTTTKNGVTDSTTTKDGKLVGKKSENVDGSFTERKVNDDKSITFHDQKKDGSYVETRTDKDGTAKTVHDITADGGSTVQRFDAKGEQVQDRVTKPDGSYIDKTRNKDGTTTRHDQKANGDFSEVTMNDNGEMTAPAFAAKGTASPEFVSKVRDQINAMPDGVKKTLAQDHTTIVATGKVLDAIPEKAGEKPRGHKEGTTWNDLDGAQVPEGKKVLIAERTNDYRNNGFSQRTEGVLNHETGHAVDRALGNDSSSPEFKAAYEKDVAAMTDAQKSRNEYELQTQEAGRSEAFAEVYAGLRGATCNKQETEQTLQDFPNVAEYMRKRIDGLPH